MNYEKYSEVIIPPEADLKLPTNNNSRYFYNNKIKQLVLDIEFASYSGEEPREFKLQLADPLIIDVEHDIFLDVAITDNFKDADADLDDGANMAFLLKIDQFNIQTKSATTPSITPSTIPNNINGTILIPNEGGHIHKGRKHNYVGTITPAKLMHITGKVIDLDGNNPISAASARLIAEFKLVPRE